MDHAKADRVSAPLGGQVLRATQVCLYYKKKRKSQNNR